MTEIVKPFNFIKDVFDNRFDIKDPFQEEKYIIKMGSHA